MIIDKVKDFYTDAEREKLKALRDFKASADRKQANAAIAGDFALASQYAEEWERVFLEESELIGTVEDRYIESLNGDPAKILEDVAEIVAKISKKDYIKYLRNFENIIDDSCETMKRNGIAEPDERANESRKEIKKMYPETAEGCYRFMLHHIRVQLNALVDNPEGTEAAKRKVFERADNLFPSAPLPEITTPQPHNHIVSNGPLVNHMFADKWEPDKPFGYLWSMQTAKGKKAPARINQAVITISGNYEPAEKALGRYLTEFERQVSDAVCTLAEAAKAEGVPAVFDKRMIYQAMPGGGDRPGESMEKLITDTLNLFQALKVKVCLRDEVTARNRESLIDEIDIETLFIPWKKITAKRSGNIVADAIILLDEPFPLIYARATGQVFSYPSRYMELHEIVRKNGEVKQHFQLMRMSPQRQAIAGYLLRLIAVMRHDREAAKTRLKYYNARKRKAEKDALKSGRKPTPIPEKTIDDMKPRFNGVLTFKTIFDAAGVVTASREIERRNRQFVYDVLDNQVIYENIKAYKKHPNENRPTGVKIDFF